MYTGNKKWSGGGAGEYFSSHGEERSVEEEMFELRPEKYEEHGQVCFGQS